MSKIVLVSRLTFSALFILLQGCATNPDLPPPEETESGMARVSDSRKVDGEPQVRRQRHSISQGDQPPETMAADLTEEEMNIHFVNVGQGDATILESSCGAVLVDTGGENNPEDEVKGDLLLASYLRGFFERRQDLDATLAAVYLTHPHVDHTAGVDNLIESGYQVINVIDNGMSAGRGGGADQVDLREYAPNSGGGYAAISNGEIEFTGGLTNQMIDPIDCGGVDPRLSVLWGRVSRDLHAWAADVNNSSLVIRVDFGEVSVLFTGDLEEAAIPEFLASYSPEPGMLDVDIYQAGHHGSRNGTTRELVCAMTPEAAVISAGDASLSRARFSAYSFGHPNRHAVQLLEDPECGVTRKRANPTL